MTWIGSFFTVREQALSSVWENGGFPPTFGFAWQSPHPAVLFALRRLSGLLPVPQAHSHEI